MKRKEPKKTGSAQPSIEKQKEPQKPEPKPIKRPPPNIDEWPKR